MEYSEVKVIREYFAKKLPNVTVFVIEQWHPRNGDAPLFRVSLVDLDAKPTCVAGESKCLWEAVYQAYDGWVEEHKEPGEAMV